MFSTSEEEQEGQRPLDNHLALNSTSKGDRSAGKEKVHAED
jgi:hypothetical protein